MELFKRKKSIDLMDNVTKLHKEISTHVQMNQELKRTNEELKIELLAQQKEQARFEEKFRKQPLSQLTVLQKELEYLIENVNEVLDDKQSMMNQQLYQKTHAICTSSFALLNVLKSKLDKEDQIK